MRRPGFALAALTFVAAAMAIWLFPRAVPTIALENRVSREAARAVADSFLAHHALAPDTARRAMLFGADDTLNVFLELNGGGRDSLDRLLRDREISVFGWTVRAFVPGEVDEVDVRLSPDGRVLGFRRLLSDSLIRPDPGDSIARALADTVASSWLGEPPAPWRLTTTSYEVVNPSGRVDRTYLYERDDRTISGAPIRLEIVVAGDWPRLARPYVAVPDAFLRRYAEMRSANDLLALLATMGALVIVVAGVSGLRRQAGRGIRWTGPAWVGGTIGALQAVSGFNTFPLTWAFYDTATPEAFHLVIGVIGALGAGAATAVLVAITLAAAESLTRAAFPEHVDWWQWWRQRGTSVVAGQVAGGYAAAAVGFAYIATFYVATRTLLGWWVPTSLLDDPNLIATAVPWVSAVAVSLQAAVWEEALFRAIPLSLIAIATRDRPDRERWMALGVVVTALVFGFAHSNYPSWPPYSRGVEIFLEACLWALLFLRFGLLVPVLAHFFYDVILFGLFAAAGDSAAYRVSAAVVGGVVALPAIVVLLARLRQGRWSTLPDEARLGAWTARPASRTPAEPLAIGSPLTGRRARPLALAAVAALLLATALIPPGPVAGPPFTADRNAVAAVADSLLRSRGEDPAAWRRLTRTARDTAALWRAFLVRHEAESLAVSLGGTYAMPAWWEVRYVRGGGDLRQRAWEWRVRVLPDGRPLDVRRILPDSEPRPVVAPDSSRRFARAALERFGDAGHLVERQLDVERRPAREDVVLTYADTAVHLPGDAEARARVVVAGDEVLSARRLVHLPESFVRDQRRRMTSELVAVVPLVMALLGVLLWAVIRTMRQRQPVAAAVPSWLARRLLAALAVVWIADSLLGLPGHLAGYDTAQSWPTFVTTLITVQVLSLAGVLALAAIWMLVNGLRRRLDIPVVAATGDGRTWSDDVVIGLGLGAVAPLMQHAGHGLLPDEFARVPGTMLDAAVPVLAMLPDVVSGGAAALPAIAIPVLAVVGAVRTSQARLWLGAVVAALFGGIALVAANAAGSGPEPVRLLWSIASFGVTIGMLRAWGGLSVVTWVVAALLWSVNDGWRTLFHAGTPVEQAAGALAAGVAAALIVGIARWVRRGAPAVSDGTAA